MAEAPPSPGSVAREKAHGPPVPKHMQGRVADPAIVASNPLRSEEDGLLGAPMKPKEKSMEECCLDALKAVGIPAKTVKLHDGVLKGGYICATRRIEIEYESKGDP